MSDIGTLISDLGGAVQDIFTGQGAAAEAQSFQGAATLANQNAALSAASTRIQEAQTARSVYQSLGTTQADIAGAGFTNSGSALAIMRSSASQGALATSLVNIQGAINENSYAAQAGAYQGEANAANEKSKAGTVGAIASIGGALISGTGQLVSAGKTVVSGYKAVSNFFGGGADAADTAAEAAQSTGETVSTIPVEVSDLAPLTSGTDAAISEGADVGADISLDTSEIGLDTTEEVASEAVDEAATEAATDVAADTAFDAAGDAIPVVGQVLMAAQVVHAIGIGGTVGSIADDITSAAGSVINGVVGAVEDVGSAVGSVFGSVICTAFHQRQMITTDVWVGAQRYGRALDPIAYSGYLKWAYPIARMISRHLWFAYLMLPILRPAVKEMSHLMGYGHNEKRSVYGIVTHRILLCLSWIVGYYKIKGTNYAKSST